LIVADPQLSQFAGAVSSSPELVASLDAAGGVQTVFVPTNGALAGSPDWPAIASDPAALAEFVRGHVVNGAYTVDDLFGSGGSITNTNGDVLVIDPGTGTVNGASIVVGDQPATNGYVHPVSAPLVTVVPAAPT
jgi:uncharacterized surface protein with fasciclin (FAS1) repeats